jgi:PIN domain nuclease of toxin-antitoxin system
VKLLLDTHAAIWLGTGSTMTADSRRAIRASAQTGDVHVSPVSAWEIGLLAAKGRLRLGQSTNAWFAQLLATPGLRLAPLEYEAAIEASFLPGQLHGDPADRLIIATARHLDAVLVTHDASILSYGAAGHVKVLAC